VRRAPIARRGLSEPAIGALTVSKVTEELIGETARVCEREEMATWKLVHGDVKALLCDAALELDSCAPGRQLP
jgi:hypothetical protein